MNIAVFMPSLQDGGVQKVVVNLYSELKKKKINLSIIAADGNGCMSKYIDDDNLIDLKKYKYRGDYKCLFSINSLRKTIKNGNYDIIIAVPGFASISLLTANFFLKKKVKTIIMVDNTISLLKKGKLKHKISYYLYKFFYKYATKIVVAHDVGMNDIINAFKLSRTKVTRIYHPMIDLVSIDNSKKPNHKWLNKNNYIVFSAGRLCLEKNYPCLIDAFKLFKEKIENSKLIIAGKGEELDNIKETILKNNLQDCVDLIGYTDNVIGYMKESDLFVLSSKQEAFGIVLVEALACKTKIVSTDCESGAQKEILSNGKYGFLCNINDSYDLYSKMYIAYNDKSQNYKDNNYNRAKDFTIEKSTNEYIKLFKEITK